LHLDVGLKQKCNATLLGRWRFGHAAIGLTETDGLARIDPH